MKLIKEGNFLFLPVFLDFSSLLFLKRMKSTMDFFPVIKTRLVGVTKLAKTRLSIVADLS